MRMRFALGSVMEGLVSPASFVNYSARHISMDEALP